MIKLIQFPWSTYCMVTRWLLRFGDVPYEVINIPPLDRSLPWSLTQQRSYRVPLLDDGGQMICETNHETQDIAKHLDARFGLDLFPAEHEGMQSILWRYIENEVEDPAFRLNDIYYQDWLPPEAQLPHLQYKERRFGAGCIAQWRAQQAELLAQLTERLRPFESMLAHADFLLGDCVRFVDLDLAAMLECFLYSGKYELPRELPLLGKWYDRLSAARYQKSVTSSQGALPTPSAIAQTPAPPYFAVIFTSQRTEGEHGYGAIAKRMVELASKQPGFLGVESARGPSGAGITTSYWRSLEDIHAWRQNDEHLAAQEAGKATWYAGYHVRICEVQRSYMHWRTGG